MSKMNKFFLVLAAIICITFSTSGIASSAFAAGSDATLIDLTIDGVTIEGFSSDVFTYDITVGNTITSVEIGATATDALAVVSGHTGTQNLTVGNNTFTVTCTSEDGLTAQDYTVNITREPSSNAQLSFIRINGNLLEGFSNDIYTYNLSVDFPVDKIEIDATAIHTGAVVSGDTGTQILYADLNTLTITCTAEDGVTAKDYVLNITRPATSSSALTDLGFQPMNVAMDPSANIAYMTAVSGHSLYRANLDTGNITYLTFENKAYDLVCKNQKVYLTLLHGPYPNSGVETGTIAVINISDFTLSHTFDVALAPLDIEADDDGVVYISPAKYATYEAKSYNSATGDLISTGTIRYSSYIDYNQQYNKIYSIFLGGTPQSLSANQIANGAFTSNHSWPYHGDYSTRYPFEVSPDGQFVFTGSGNIFTCAPTSEGDMVYHDSIYRFEDISFDGDNGVFYVADGNFSNNLLTYDYSTLTVINQFTAKDSFRRIFYNNNKLACLMSKSYSSGFYFSLNPEESSKIKPVTGISLSKDEINLMPSDTEQLLETVSPNDATNKHVLWTTSDPSVATIVDNEVFAHSVGTCQITATTLDGGYTATCTINVVPTPLVSASTTTLNGLENLGFTPNDVVLDPTNQVAYLTAKASDKLYRVDLVTGEVKYQQFIYYAQNLAIKDGELYLQLGRDYTYGGPRNSKVIVVNTDTFTMSDYIDFAYTTYDIVLDAQNILYVMQDSTSGGIISFDTNTLLQLGNFPNNPSNELWEYNQLYNKLYTVRTGGSPREMYAAEITNGIVTNMYDSPYHGDYGLYGYFKISPDGRYLYNSSGNIFSCQPTESGDMVYFNHIDPYTALCFDETNNKFYTGDGKILKEYNLGTQSFNTSHMVEDEIHELHYKYGQINAIQINSSGQYYFSTITEDDYINPYVQTAAYSGNALTNLGFEPEDIVIDNTNGMAYITAKNDNKLYQANLTTGQMQYMEFIYPAESITLRNSKVYVSLLHGEHYWGLDDDGTGTVAIVDTDTFSMNNFFVIEVDPYDIEVDSQGFVYIGPGSSSHSVSFVYNSITGQRVGGIRSVDYQSLWDYNEQYQKLYSISQHTSPRDIVAYETANGDYTDSYDSPYHGHYQMTPDISISTDGQYIFNSSGNIFTCAPTEEGDMVYNGNIDAFTSIEYDLANNTFFTSLNNVLKVYAYDNRSIAKQYTDENDFIKLYYWSNKLIALKVNDEGIYYIDTETGTGVNTTGVSIDDGEVNVGDTLQLTPTVTPSDATNKTVSYSSSNENVATVDSSGLVTGVSIGGVTITATTQDGGFTDTCTVIVCQPATGVTMRPQASHCWVSKTIQLSYIISPAGVANQEVTYTSDNEAVATVDAQGVVTGVAAGTAIITVKTSDGGFTDICTVTVDEMITNDKVAVIFGMADYVGIENDLNGPVHDMIGMEEVLEHAGYKVFMYMDYTRADLLREVERITQGISPETTLLFGFSGHGADGGFLIGANGYGISIEDLESRLSLHPGVKEVLIDSCYSGDFIAKGIEGKSIQSINSQEEFNNYIISVFKDSDTHYGTRSLNESEYYVMTASSGSQLSYELLFTIPNSPFAAANYTPTVIDGQNYYWLGHFSSSFHLGFGLYNDTPFSTAYADSNSDNYITWHEMFTYIADRVADKQNAQVYPEYSTHVIGRATGGSFTSVMGVTIEETAQLDVGATIQLTAEVQPAQASYTAVSFSSDNETVATVDAVGMVWAHSTGTATITVTTEDGGHTDTCVVTVGQPVTGVTLSHESTSMIMGGTLQLTATVAPANASNATVTYSSDNEAVATVNAAGLVTSHATGSAVITVTTQDGAFTDTCNIMVVDELITSHLFTVNRLQGYLEDVHIGVTAQVMIDMITNSTGEVRVLDADRQPITGDMLISTGYYVQLVINDVVVDELCIIIEGDVNPDTLLNIIDYTLIRLHILELEELTGIALEVADVNDDGIINIIDYTLVRLHILELESLY